MQVYKFFMRFFPSSPEKIPPKDQSRRNDDIVRAVAQRNAEGSVLLGRGKILTAKDKERAYRTLVTD